MRRDEFTIGIDELRKTFGKDKYPEVRIEKFWDALQKLPDGVFRAMVDEFIQTARQAPLLPEFREMASRLAPSRTPVPKTYGEACSACNGHGFFLMKNDATNSLITASCEQCEKGRDLRSRPRHAIITLSEARGQGYLRVRKFNEAARDERWVSAQAPGIPASVEALCMLIKSGRSNSPAFRFGLTYNGLKDEEIWQIYEAWGKGEVHPLALKRKPGLAGALKKGKTDAA